LAARDGEPRVKLQHLCADSFRKEIGVEGDKETKHIEEGGKKQRGRKNPEERIGQECEETGKDDDSTVTDDSFTGTLSVSGALAGLLSLNASKGKRSEGGAM
jgi:hypothetical protein